jgi:uncharacterized phage protein (TIGR01671 family)
MKEIKFRAWERIYKTMYNPAWPTWNGNIEVWLHNIHQSRIETLLPWADSEPVLMQFTGLFDKNGAEIYEGDICKTIALSNDHNQLGATSTVIVKYFMGNPCLCFDNFECGVPIYPFNVDHVIEIIGNIYENHELVQP